MLLARAMEPKRLEFVFIEKARAQEKQVISRALE